MFESIAPGRGDFNAVIATLRDERRNIGALAQLLRHPRDLALLLLLATQAPVRALADELTKKDRSRLRAAVAVWIDDDLHEAWFAVESRNDTRRLVALVLGFSDPNR